MDGRRHVCDMLEVHGPMSGRLVDASDDSGQPYDSGQITWPF